MSVKLELACHVYTMNTCSVTQSNYSYTVELLTYKGALYSSRSPHGQLQYGLR